MDKKNGNTYWQDAMPKGMENMKVTFQNLPNDEKTPNGYQFVNYHIVFDVKMKDFRKKHV